MESPPGIRPTPGLQVGEPRTFKGLRKPPDTPGLQHRAPSCPCTQQSSGDPWSRQPRRPASTTVSGFAWSCEPSLPRTPSGSSGHAHKGDGQRRGPSEGRFQSCCSDHPLKTQRHRDSLSPEPSPAPSQIRGPGQCRPHSSREACHQDQMTSHALPASILGTAAACFVFSVSSRCGCSLAAPPLSRFTTSMRHKPPCTSHVFWPPCLLTPAPFSAYFSQLWPCCPLAVLELASTRQPQGLCTYCPSVRTSFPACTCLSAPPPPLI